VSLLLLLFLVSPRYADIHIYAPLCGSPMRPIPAPCSTCIHNANGVTDVTDKTSSIATGRLTIVPLLLSFNNNQMPAAPSPTVFYFANYSSRAISCPSLELPSDLAVG
jgi:hypothetical protein